MKSTAEYLGLDLDQRLTWQAHVIAIQRIKNQLIVKNSQVFVGSKFILCRAILKPIRTCDIKLWNVANFTSPKYCKFSIKILHLIANTT